MASLGHVAVGMAVARRRHVAGDSTGPLLLAMLLWSGLSLLPDLDVVGFSMGVAYGDPWGHRGASHSLLFALLVGGGATLLPSVSRSTGFWVFIVVASHGLLDTLTNGGLGIALGWPFTDERWFAPWRPIPVGPIGRGLWSTRALFVIAVEAAMFAPLLAYALWPRRK